VPERLGAASERALGLALRSLGTELDYPSMPMLAVRVRNRLERDVSPADVRVISPPYRPIRRGLAFVVVGLLLLGGAATAARFAVRGVEIRFRTTEPTIVPTSRQPRGATTDVGRLLSLGERVTLAEARRRIDFPIQLPALPSLAEPDAVYVDDDPIGGRVTAVYPARPGLPEANESGVGLLITQFRAGFDEQVVVKEAGPGTRVEQLSVNGDPGYWVEGDPHSVVYVDEAGSMFPDTLRLAGNTLLWEHEGITFRLEADITKPQALTIARSFR
jgi:hypothetical protein